MKNTQDRTPEIRTPRRARPGGPAAKHVALALSAALLLASQTALALQAGDPVADFEAPLLGSKQTLSLADYRGKVVYLDFWASWCDPCQKAIPAIEKLRSEFPASEFQVVAVNIDKSTKKAMKFLKKNPIGYPSVTDLRGKLSRAFGFETMPTSYLIDRKGVIRYVHSGFRDEDVPELREQISKLVGKKR